MKIKQAAFGFFVLVVFLAVSLSGQTRVENFKTFDKDGLKFNYPADWTVIDRSSAETQNLMLMKNGALVLISIVSPLGAINSQEHYFNLQTNINSRYVEAIKRGLTSSQQIPDQEGTCIDLHGRSISGNKFTGLYNNEPSRGDVYPFVLGNRFITLIYLRSEKDSSVGDPVWLSLIESLYLADSNKEVAHFSFDFTPIDVGVVNGKAITLVRPPYPVTDQANAQGLVIIRVVIDEQGKVISTKLVSGYPSLVAVSLQAARFSKFKPTLRCNKPVRITGVIHYNFDPRDPYKPPPYDK